MNFLVVAVAFASALLSALAFYVGSAHCRWAALRRWHRAGGVFGIGFALASSALWVAGLGIGAGLCAMLAAWMSGAIVLPYLALLASPASGGEKQ